MGFTNCSDVFDILKFIPHPFLLKVRLTHTGLLLSHTLQPRRSQAHSGMIICTVTGHIFMACRIIKTSETTVGVGNFQENPQDMGGRGAGGPGGLR